MDFKKVSVERMIYGMLFSLTNRIQTYGDSQFGDITMKQLFLMIGLESFEDHYPTLKEVSDLIGSSYQNVKRMALQLEKAGYLKLAHDPADKRKFQLILTEKYTQFAERQKEDADRFLAQLYQGLSKDQLQITLQTLIQMDKNIGGNINEKV